MSLYPPPQKSPSLKVASVRSRSIGKIPLLLCLLTAVLTAMLIGWLGYEKCAPAATDSTFTATAYVVEKLPSSEAVELRIPMAYSDNNRQRAEDVANALADRYVEDRRREWKRGMEELLLKTHETVKKARLELAGNETRLEAFKNELAGKIAKPQAAELSLPLPLPKPSIVDNPAWLDLNRRLSDLEQRRDDLLTDRTLLHPVVQEVAMQIEEVEEQLAAIPCQISQKLYAPSESGERAKGQEKSKPLITSNIIADQDQQRLDELTSAVETSRRAHQEAQAAEKKAIAKQKQRSGPQYSVAYAETTEIASTTDHGWRRLMVTALMAGVFMALGIGAFSAGTAIDPPVGTIAQVRTAARVPVLGTIPANHPVPDAITLSRRQLRERRVLISIGLILIAACPAVAFWGIAGI